jgi:hypothetical protein
VESALVLVGINATLLNGLVGWWKFDETNGMVAYDSSGNGNDGNLTNGPTWTTGKIAGAMSFDGVDDRVSVPKTALNGLNDLTINLWTKLIKGSQDHFFFSGASDLEANHLLLAITRDDEIHFWDKNIHVIDFPFPSINWDNKWINITLVRRINGTGSHVLIDGTHVASQNYDASTLSISDSGLWFGADQDNPGGGGWSSSQFLSGLMDDLRIYDRALSTAEVQALYNLGQ